MKFSDKGIKLLAELEGVELKRYKDVGGLWTIGVGHLITGKENPPIGDEITYERALELLHEDVQRFVDEFQDGDGFADLPEGLSQNEFDACVIFAFNIGLGGFDSSTALKKIEEGDMQAAAIAMSWWNKVKGKVVNGLVNRRREEIELMTEGDYEKG